MIALLLVPICGMAALVIDVGSMYMIQAELQIAADAAALAAAGEMSGADADVYLQAGIDGARYYAAKHTSFGMDGGLQLADADIEFGTAEHDGSESTWTFQADPDNPAPTAVRVTVRRDGVSNPKVPFSFAHVLGFGESTLSATAASMITPRDIALVVDLSRSMSYDSELMNKDEIQINLRDVWVTLEGAAGSPSTKYIDGKGTYITDYELKRPDESVYASREGRTFGNMCIWGTNIERGAYNDAAIENDLGLAYLPTRNRTPSKGWQRTLSTAQFDWIVHNTSNPYSLKSRGYGKKEIRSLMERPDYYERESDYVARVEVVLGLADWNDADHDKRVDSWEVTTTVDEPYSIGCDWSDWISEMDSDYGIDYADSDFKYRYGLKTYVNWLITRSYSKDYVAGGRGRTPQLQFTPLEPLQAMKDAIQGFTDYLDSVNSHDRVGLVVYGTRGSVDDYSTSNGLTDDYDAISDLPYPHQPGENGGSTNTADGVVHGYRLVYGTGSRDYAHKVIVFMSDGYANQSNGYSYFSNLDDPHVQSMLGDVSSVEDFDSLIGYPASRVYGNSTAARQETVGLANMMASNLLGLGEAEFNVVGVGANADVANLLQPLAEASGGDAYRAVPDVDDPGAMHRVLREIYEEIGGRRPVALIATGL